MFPTVNPTSEVPAVEERLRHMEEIRSEIQASLNIAAERMKIQNDDFVRRGKGYEVGDKVTLDGKNLRTTRPKAKLANKRHGPFEVLEVLGPVTYKLKLPKKWLIHPVFHASLLKPYKETDAHGPNFPGEPADLLPEDTDYDVERILDSRKPRSKRRKIEYYIKWLDYPDSENSWEPVSALGNVKEMIAEFHKQHPSAYCVPGVNAS